MFTSAIGVYLVNFLSSTLTIILHYILFVEHSEHKHGHDHAHGHAHGGEEAPKKKKKRVHNLSLVSSVGFTIVGLLDVALFNAFMSSLLQTKAADLYRTKGVLAFANQGMTGF